jgi:UDP-galactopyranose mutase
MDSIIVFSHLRWDFVYQRPQHLLSRLAKHYRILFLEEPEFQPCKAALDISTPLPNLTVCKPITPIDKHPSHDDHLRYLRHMVRDLAPAYPDPIVWFYAPMALPLLDELTPRCVVYDCMDELSAFKNAPPNLIEREDKLLDIADLVFTGGPSLYQAKKDRNSNVYCFPSSVDVSHFRQALDRNIAHPMQRQLLSPRLGFYGVIDERFDAELMAQVADAHPEWQIVLVGPVVKIDPASLPQRPNIHYMGQQPYSVLPQFLAAWDVCLMPFALNESTRFISPTKSLEYMAAELPIVSTPVKDVVDLHSDVVEIANGPAGFIAACERMLELSAHEKQEKINLMRDKLSRTSWNFTAAKMGELLEQVVPQQEFPEEAGPQVGAAAAIDQRQRA